MVGYQETRKNNATTVHWWGRCLHAAGPAASKVGPNGAPVVIKISSKNARKKTKKKKQGEHNNYFFHTSLPLYFCDTLIKIFIQISSKPSVY